MKILKKSNKDSSLSEKPPFVPDMRILQVYFPTQLEELEERLRKIKELEEYTEQMKGQIEHQRFLKSINNMMLRGYTDADIADIFEFSSEKLEELIAEIEAQKAEK